MTTNSKGPWQRVGRRRPCPVCGRPDWCLYTGDAESPTAVICARVESPKRCGEGGWLHVLRDDGPAWAPWRCTLPRIALTLTACPSPACRCGTSGRGEIDLAALAADCRRAVQPAVLARLAAVLGVSAENLGRLGIGWSTKHRAWTFPMQDAGGTVLGIRLRRPDGRKLAVRGGHEGLFIPHPISLIPMDKRDAYPTLIPMDKRDAYPTALLIAEGPTDTAALLDLGFRAVGRPSCTGGVKLLAELVKRWRGHPHPGPLPVGEGDIREVVIVADGDAPGQRGAESLAAVLVAYCPAVRVIVPPAGVKDAREWKRRGATAGDIQATIDAAPVRRLTITTTVRKRKAGARHGR